MCVFQRGQHSASLVTATKEEQIFIHVYVNVGGQSSSYLFIPYHQYRNRAALLDSEVEAVLSPFN
jgi:hypothetical protein